MTDRTIRPLPAVNRDDVEWQGIRFGTTFVKVLSFRNGVNCGTFAGRPSWPL